ncbi:hypothetical protein BDV95DRAFT_495370 [Massariosphaeria phaeospora]|uniref:Uncharacterized protein n=1 Tax=Massariosphaeria phaeospora TaxID=100035 RepID=A0A7C8M4X0_9PLEO|nr:hypothetical protein BDV95DRAFT_495370 [Massariosphaeria phaeospora]
MATPNAPDHRTSLGPNAPSPDVPFPASANITAVELLTFFPNCLKCVDVVYRFASNGGTRQCFYIILNTGRELERVWSANTCGVCIYKTMRTAGYDKWAVKKHYQWHAEREEAWDEANLDVGGFQTPGQRDNKNISGNDIAFADLALDVRNFPRHSDALDLTRMVQYAAENPEEGWQYPKDYKELLDLLGGPAKVTAEHTDRKAFNRWKDAGVPKLKTGFVFTPRTEPLAPPKRNRKCKRAVSETPARQMRKRGRPARKSARFEADDEEERPAKKRPAKKRTAKKRARVGTHDEEERLARKKYIRPEVRYILCPSVAHEPSAAEMKFVFWAEGAAHEFDPYSPYAFYGPRQSPPYRALHHIASPDACDTGGWAENLRWAAEQQRAFGPTGWNESPEHMEMLVGYRQEQRWVSDEWMLVEGAVVE